MAVKGWQQIPRLLPLLLLLCLLCMIAAVVVVAAEVQLHTSGSPPSLPSSVTPAAITTTTIINNSSTERVRPQQSPPSSSLHVLKTGHHSWSLLSFSKWWWPMSSSPRIHVSLLHHHHHHYQRRRDDEVDKGDSHSPQFQRALQLINNESANFLNESVLITGELILPLQTFWLFVVQIVIPAVTVVLLLGCLVLEPLCSRYDSQLLNCIPCQLVADSALSLVNSDDQRPSLQRRQRRSPSVSSFRNLYDHNNHNNHNNHNHNQNSSSSFSRKDHKDHDNSSSSFDTFCRRLSVVFKEQERTVERELSGKEKETFPEEAAMMNSTEEGANGLRRARPRRPNSVGSLASWFSFDSFRRGVSGGQLASGSAITLTKFTFDDSKLFRGPETPTSQDDPLKHAL